MIAHWYIIKRYHFDIDADIRPDMDRAIVYCQHWALSVFQNLLRE